jgi:hypothetical protein
MAEYLRVWIEFPDGMVPADELYKDLDKIEALSMKYISMYQRAEQEAIKKLSKHAYRLLCYFRSEMNRGNIVVVSSRQACKGAKLSAGYFAESIKELKQNKYITEDGTERRKIYTVSPAFGFNGSSAERRQAFAVFRKKLEIQGLR